MDMNLTLNRVPCPRDRKEFVYTKTALAGKLLTILCLLGGCGAANTPGKPRRLAEPIEPLPDSDNVAYGIDPQYQSARDKHAIQLVLSYFNNGRDFVAPAGADGYVLNVIPLNAKYQAFPVEGNVTISLWNNDSPNNKTTKKPLKIWRINDDVLPKYWQTTRLLDGYIFRLSWGSTPMPPGEYQFLVRMDYKQGKTIRTVYQHIVFVDSVS